ncbi:acyltransferase [Polynucleobacter sp. Adler-ghost]|uniref:acyltransferase family protein n=1 Tax=Polynucleobacter sp. Adler-ghost TaxID=2770234 RepID=UPI001BFE3B83|nr:acyltransferase family protein [Polynucleobacter sp. Adler-ghost]QWE31088.1 acyltransferase [Polynucleobacter sp. Adler-ghost]
MQSKNHFLLVDSFKVFAALLIILHHLSSYGQMAVDARSVLPGLMTWLFEYGRYAVQVFLVMAGYLAAQSLTRFANTQFSSQTLLRVIINRYLRLFAPYIAALVFTIFCAWIARFWVNDEFVGEQETLSQFIAHLFFLQGILGLDSISAGAWYVAIDWQLYSVFAVLLISFSSYQALIWLISIVAVSSLLYFNRSAQYEAYFIYFIGSYGLGVLAYLAKHFADKKIQVLAKFALIAIGLIIAISALHQVWLRNFLAWFVALLLFVWGNTGYPSLLPRGSKVKAYILHSIAWASPLSYCAFLIHFAFILLANTLYIASGMHAHESGLIAISLMLGVVVCSTIAASYLYRWVEIPSAKLKI